MDVSFFSDFTAIADELAVTLGPAGMYMFYNLKRQKEKLCEMKEDFNTFKKEVRERVSAFYEIKDNFAKDMGSLREDLSSIKSDLRYILRQIGLNGTK